MFFRKSKPADTPMPFDPSTWEPMKIYETKDFVMFAAPSVGRKLALDVVQRLHDLGYEFVDGGQGGLICRKPN